jgi:hypothetical protein
MIEKLVRDNSNILSDFSGTNLPPEEGKSLGRRGSLRPEMAKIALNTRKIRHFDLKSLKGSLPSVHQHRETVAQTVTDTPRMSPKHDLSPLTHHQNNKNIMSKQFNRLEISPLICCQTLLML